jgi:type VI secretion system secreted protein VgrG
MGIETEREMEFHCSLGKDALMVRRFTGMEQLGEMFEYVVSVFSTNHNVKSESLLGKHASVEVRFGLGSPRFFDGIVAEFSHVGSEEDHALYTVVLRPWLWLLTRNRESRVYQNRTSLEIAKEIFQRKGFTDLDERLFYGLPTREYCVQYGESDFDFISRLFEHEGIYYFWKHEKGKHTLVLADSLSAHDVAAGFDEIGYKHKLDPTNFGLGQFHSWTATKQVAPGKVTLNDYNFKKSRASLNVDRADPKDHSHSDAEVYLYPGSYDEAAKGTDKATIRMEEAASGYETARGSTDCQGFSLGDLFTLKRHPRDDQNREYLIASTQYTIDSGQYRSGGASALRMSMHVTVLDSKTQFRPARNTPIPSVSGPQTARVVGPKGKEIWTDEFGRVKVQFAWDRHGKNNEESSCFIRVSQAWAGGGWGSIHVPRIGQEVIVDFIDGDLDRPLIVGRVYNDSTSVPYPLPENATQSGIKSHTHEGGREEYNELRFEDLKGKEEVHLRAQRDMTTEVLHDKSTNIGHDHAHTVKNAMTVKVQDGPYETYVEKNAMYTEVAQEYDLKALRITEDAEQDITLLVGQSKLLIDLTGITLSAFGHTIVLNAAGITIDGKMVKINSSA